MNKIEKKIGRILVLMTVTLLFAGCVYGPGFYHARGNPWVILPGTGYGDWNHYYFDRDRDRIGDRDRNRDRDGDRDDRHERYNRGYDDRLHSEHRPYGW